MTSPDIAGASNSVDLTRPSAARVYAYFLGATGHWAIDRGFAQRAIRQFPLVRHLAMTNRRWSGRVVTAALDAGITQFLDLGSGPPAVGAVHEIVAQHPGQGKVVYVDNDPIVYSHMQIMLDETDGSGLRGWMDFLGEDLKNPDVILAAPETQKLIDFTRPVCVLMGSVLDFVDRETDVPALLSRYRDAVAPGSWLAISHGAHDAVTDAAVATQMADLVASYQETPTPAYLRNHGEIATWLTEWGPLLPPGLVHLPDWRPDEPELDQAEADVRPFSWCGVSAQPDRYQ